MVERFAAEMHRKSQVKRVRVGSCCRRVHLALTLPTLGEPSSLYESVVS